MGLDKSRLPDPSYFYYEQGLEKLKVKGNKATACCPFHADRTPSFTIWMDTGKWKCFGCGEAGDMIEFYKKMHSVDFVQAAKNMGAWV